MNSRICIAGIGRGGCMIVDEVAKASSHEAPVFAIDTDASGFEGSSVSDTIMIGGDELRTSGTRGDVRLGAEAGENGADEFARRFTGMELVITVTCLGGGTGSGATPAVLRAARDAGAMTLCIVTMPFDSEGRHKLNIASDAISLLREKSDAFVMAESDDVLELLGEVPIGQIYEKVSKVLGIAVGAIWNAVTDPEQPGIDFNDLRDLLRGSSGCGILGFGYAEGVGRVEAAVRMLMESPMLDGGRVLRNSAGAVICIAGGSDMTVAEYRKAKTTIAAETGKACHALTGPAISERWQCAAISVIAFEQFSPRRAEGTSSSETSAGNEMRQSEKGRKKSGQAELVFDALGGQGRFKDSSPTIMDGADLDTPTFMRRGIVIQK